MVALCQPVGASFLPDFCYKVHGFDERLKVVSKIPTSQRKLLGYSPTRAEVNLSPAGRTSFAWLAQNLGVAWPLTAGPHVAGLVSRGCFLRPKRPASDMGGRRHRQARCTTPPLDDDDEPSYRTFPMRWIPLAYCVVIILALAPDLVFLLHYARPTWSSSPR